MTSPGADRYLSAAFRNKSLPERLRDLEAMVEAITDCAIIQLDANGDVARWCPGAEAMTGYSAAEVLGGRRRCSTPRRTAPPDWPNANWPRRANRAAANSKAGEPARTANGFAPVSRCPYSRMTRAAPSGSPP